MYIQLQPEPDEAFGTVVRHAATIASKLHIKVRFQFEHEPYQITRRTNVDALIKAFFARQKVNA